MIKPRHKRLLIILAAITVIGAAIALTLSAFNSNLVFLFSPTQVAAGDVELKSYFNTTPLLQKIGIRFETKFGN